MKKQVSAFFTKFKLFNTQFIFYKTSPNFMLKIQKFKIFLLIAENKKVS